MNKTRIDEKNLLTYRIVILSNYASGETSIINSYIDLEFKVDTPITISGSYVEKDVTLNNNRVIGLVIWDMKGSLHPAFLGRSKFMVIDFAHYFTICL